MGWYLWTHQLLEVTGEDAASFLEGIFPSPIANLKPGRERYTTMLDEKGEIIDDVVVFRAYKAAVGSVLAVVLAIGSYGTVPLFLVPLSQSLGVSIGQVSLLFTFAASAGLVASLFFGTILKKLGVKGLACLSGAALATFYVFLFLAKSPVMVYIGAMIYGFSTSTGGFAIAQTEITWWFSKGRAKVMSLLNIGVGLVGMVLAPVVASALEALGMRSVALIQGLLTGGLMIVNGLIFLSEHPSTYGMHPMGYVAE